MMPQTLTATSGLPDLVRPAPARAPQSVRRERLRHRRAEQRQFKFMLSLMFVVFLVMAVLSRLKPSSILALFDPDRERVSVIQEARTQAYELTPYLFQ